LFYWFFGVERNEVNQSIISEEFIIDSYGEKYGAVSAEVAQAMAEGVRKHSHVDIGIATTGIAGPTGGTKEKPVGLVYIGISTEKETSVKEFQFNGSRLENKKETCAEALYLLADMVTKTE